MASIRRWLSAGAILVGVGLSVATSSYGDWSICTSIDAPDATLVAGDAPLVTPVAVTVDGLASSDGPATLMVAIEVRRTLTDGSPDLAISLVSAAGEVFDSATLPPDSEDGTIYFYSGAPCWTGDSYGCELNVALSAEGEGSMVASWWVEATLEDSGAEQDDLPDATVTIEVTGATARDCATAG